MGPVSISDKNFQQLIAKRARTLLGLAVYVSQQHGTDKILTRPLLGGLLSQSMQIEEFLDAYDARNNCRWCSFGSLTAAIKLFADAGYELLHIQHALPAYRLLPIEQDFVKATEELLESVEDVISNAAEQLLGQAQKLGLATPAEKPDPEAYSEQLPSGRLPHNCRTRMIETVSETVTLIATAFLNLAAESEDVHAVSKVKPEEYASYVSDSVSEENLRNLELRFHNLQSLYDTYVSGTDAESLDTDLPVLRGHISVVFHLLRIGTMFAHYYERHVRNQTCKSPDRLGALMDTHDLLAMLVDYSLTFVSSYIACAERLCKEMLNRYVEPDSIEVPVPHYRGFHVRPSTLISKLVLHYGSEVQMKMEGQVYNAAVPLELFRANEQVNAHKRRWLASEIDHMGLIAEEADKDNLKTVIRNLILTLAAQNKVILYEQPLQFPDEPAAKKGTILERVTEEMALLLATGKIDINTDISVTFDGDKRVLADIKLLAENGYGEDKFGNNIPLPPKLVCLRR